MTYYVMCDIKSRMSSKLVITIKVIELGGDHVFCVKESPLSRLRFVRICRKKKKDLKKRQKE